MDSRGGVKLGLALLALGNVAWTITNLVHDLWVNVVTDIVIVTGCMLAILGVEDAADGSGSGRWRTGLVIVALAHFAQNFLNAIDGLALPDEWVLFVVMVAAIALLVGAIRWSTDGWDTGAAQWLCAGMVGIALEPAYFLLRYVWTDPWASGYLPGELLVLAGALTAAWALRPDRAPA